MGDPETIWESQAAAVLRKARRLSPDEPDDAAVPALTRTTVEGIAIPPLGRRPASEEPDDDGRRNGRAGGWQVRAAIVDADPDRAAETALTHWQDDADSLWIRVGGAGVDPAVLGRALSRVPLDRVPVVLQAAGTASDVHAAHAFSQALAKAGVAPAAGGSLGGDPLGRQVGTRGAGPDVVPVVRDLAALAGELHISALVADGTVAHRAGAGDAGELGYVLAATVAYLRTLETAGYDVAAASGLLQVRLAATDDQFATIAKFRAARVLLTRLADLCGGDGSLVPPIHAVTSEPMMTRYDPWTNLLRTTIAAFGAGVGGADSVTVLPFDWALGVSDPHAQRWARNISSLLISESHVADVRDPAGGAWAIETLTDRLAEAAWAAFVRIDDEGLMRSIENGSLLAGFGVAAAERARRINTRRQPVTGITEFPLAGEQLLSRSPHRHPVGGEESVASSWAGGFEALRDAPTAAVFVATLGPLAEHTLRAGFLRNVLTAGGIPTIEAGPTLTVNDVLAAYDGQSAVVCLAGTDAAYADRAAEVIAGLRSAGATRVVLTGAPTTSLSAQVDDYIAAGDDVLAFLLRTRQALTTAPGSENAR